MQPINPALPAGMEVLHHGGRCEVTGSCHELRLADGGGLLVDCGLHQGSDHRDPQIDFPVDRLRGLVLSHVHLDHCGRIPYLLAAGFAGPIYCSEPSALLLPAVLEDAVKVGITRNARLIEQLLGRLRKLLRPLPYRRWETVPGPSPLRIRLQPAGHILGSAWVECDAAGRRVVFSGDLGAPWTPLLPAPRSPWRADLVVLESTYGDRVHHGRRERRRELQRIIERALADRGVILIPAFAIGRTQELLYDLEEIIHRNRDRLAARDLPWDELEIVVDSPLASRFTGLYRQLKPFWDAEARRKLGAGRHPLDFDQLTTVAGHREHLNTVAYLQRRARPCIIIASSGMCSGGRIVNYLKALLGDPRTDILFSGYQAAGTPGREIQTYGPTGGYVLLDGQKYPIRAGIHTLPGYSAHADQRNLVNFIARMRHRPKEVRLVHGEETARAELAGELTRLGVSVS